MTRWSGAGSSVVAVVSMMGWASICCLMAWEMAGTKRTVFKSRSSHRTSANCSGVMHISEREQKFQALCFNMRVDICVCKSLEEYNCMSWHHDVLIEKLTNSKYINIYQYFYEFCRIQQSLQEISICFY